MPSRWRTILRSIGIEKGDRVAIMLPNCPQGVISYYGILYTGGIVVQTNPLYTERELEYQMKDSGSKAIIALDLLYPRITKIIKNTKLEHTIVTAIKGLFAISEKSHLPIHSEKTNWPCRECEA